jgi:molecular chaperone GrpE
MATQHPDQEPAPRAGDGSPRTGDGSGRNTGGAASTSVGKAAVREVAGGKAAGGKAAGGKAAGGKAAGEDAENAAASVADLEDRLRRALADADNARKRCAQQLAEERAAERARVAAVWLTVVDNLDRALAHANADAEAVIDGVRAVRDQAVGLLAALGYPRHDETGVPFDPQQHDAVSVVPDGDAPPGTVLQVVRPGYGDGTQQLRPAAVVVAGGQG